MKNSGKFDFHLVVGAVCEIAEEDVGIVLVDLPKEVIAEAKPPAAVKDRPFPIFFSEKPAETVIRCLTGIQRGRRKGFLERDDAYEFFGVECLIELKQILCRCVQIVLSIYKIEWSVVDIHVCECAFRRIVGARGVACGPVFDYRFRFVVEK